MSTTSATSAAKLRIDVNMVDRSDPEVQDTMGITMLLLAAIGLWALLVLVCFPAANRFKEAKGGEKIALVAASPLLCLGSLIARSYRWLAVRRRENTAE